MPKGQISPSNDFTDKVMSGVKKRPRKIGIWNLAYFAPIMAVVAILSFPAGQRLILDVTSPKHVAVAAAEEDIAEIQRQINDLTQFQFDDETIEIINNEFAAE
jgi:hypothetical protein